MKEKTYHFLGWAVFLASSVSFAVSAWRAGDWPALTGSILFVVACILFLVPMFRQPR